MKEADSEGVRQLTFRKNYRIVHTVRQGRVQILAIVHAGRDLGNFVNRPWEIRKGARSCYVPVRRAVNSA